MSDDDDLGRARELLARLSSRSGGPPSRSALGGLCRTAPPPCARGLDSWQAAFEVEKVSTSGSSIREDLGMQADFLLAELVREPIATASVGQVHRARLPDGVDVAVKVRHPGIEAIRHVE
jgi:hypothetical protein